MRKGNQLFLSKMVYKRGEGLDLRAEPPKIRDFVEYFHPQGAISCLMMKGNSVISAPGAVLRNFVYFCCEITKNNLVFNAAYFNGLHLLVELNSSVKKH